MASNFINVEVDAVYTGLDRWLEGYNLALLRGAEFIEDLLAAYGDRPDELPERFAELAAQLREVSGAPPFGATRTRILGESDAEG